MTTNRPYRPNEVDLTTKSNDTRWKTSAGALRFCKIEQFGGFHRV